MGLGTKRGVMWAGVVDGHIATDTESNDPYTPVTVALFKSEREARRHYESVVKIDADEWLRAAVEAKTER